MPRLRVQSRDLQPGDVLVPTGRRVTRRPEVGARTPAGKVEVFLERPTKEGGWKPDLLRTFGRYTEITVARPGGPPRPDSFGRGWPELPDNCGDCNHQAFTKNEVLGLGGVLP